tara:strand:+ start:2538 stop:3872 length:1335 start_codon:yes stop_codon:yes gene_type:complete
MKSADTIVAISTANGNAAVGIIRVSGSNTNIISEHYFGDVKERYAKYVKIRDCDGNIIDDAIVIRFVGPSSYTGEDMLEIQMHGNPILLEKFQNILCEKYCRLAKPGEFTERAYLNNKLDLVQAEAVIDLINSSSYDASLAAQRSLQGKFSNVLSEIGDQILSIRTLVESSINFPEDDTHNESSNKYKHHLNKLIERLEYLVDTAKHGLKLNNQVKISILGKPNVGKSTLSNCLLGHQASIVSETPGTTRDLVKNDLNLQNNVVTLFDTAGLRKTKDVVEAKGVDLSIEASTLSDLVLYVIDDELGVDEVDLKFLKSNKNECWIIFNKIDKTDKTPESGVYEGYKYFNLSADSESGVELLKKALKSIRNLNNEKNLTLARERHIESLKASLKNLYNASKYNDNQQLDLVGEELRRSHLHLQNILGGDVDEELLDEIFSNFCIGK